VKGLTIVVSKIRGEREESRMAGVSSSFVCTVLHLLDGIWIVGDGLMLSYHTPS